MRSRPTGRLFSYRIPKPDDQGGAARAAFLIYARRGGNAAKRTPGRRGRSGSTTPERAERQEARMDFEPIETQEQFDAAIKSRLAREREKARAEFADYES